MLAMFLGKSLKALEAFGVKRLAIGSLFILLVWRALSVVSMYLMRPVSKRAAFSKLFLTNGSEA